MAQHYRIITSEGEGLYKEKGSKFLAFAKSVESEEEVKVSLDALRKQFFDARHHCYAFEIGVKQRQTRANDDGEPNHSAGDPILGQIKSNELTNVLVVVVRYFGGTKLGVSGLINAYKTAAKEALSQCTIEDKIVTQNLKIHYPYDSTSQVMRLIDEFSLKINEQIYLESCTLDAEIDEDIKPKFVAVTREMVDTGVELNVEWID
jgi:uncharacterized YigZ family protein